MAEKKTKKREKWVKPRHRIVRNILYVVFGPIVRLRYHVKIEKFREQRKNQPYLVLMNHQTAFDQFFVGIAISGPIYYVASEDLFSNGWVSRLIRYLVAPIPFKKSTTDARGVINCIRVAREGGTIALAPEGNRTYSGKTEYIKPSIAPLAKALKLPIAFFRIEGGYGVHPRWSDKVRRGKMRAYVSRVMEYDEFRDMPEEELFSIIERELYVDETEIRDTYKSAHLAEYLERAIYVCPDCKLSRFESRGDEITCLRCGKKVRYTEDKRLVGIGCDFPFETVKDWYAYQSDYVKSLDLDAFPEGAIYEDPVSLFRVNLYKSKTRLSEEAKISIRKDSIVLSYRDTEMALPFENIRALSALGRNKLNIYTADGELYQIKGSKRFCAVKYLNLYYHAIATKKGASHGEFLGL